MAEFDEDEIEVGGDDDSMNVVDLERSAEDAPVVKLVNLILIDAIKKGRFGYPHRALREGLSGFATASTACCTRMMKPPLKLKAAITSRHQDHEPTRYC